MRTDANHGRRSYPNRAWEIVLGGVDRLWVAAIT